MVVRSYELTLFLLRVCTYSSLQVAQAIPFLVSTPQSDTYTAGVVEFHRPLFVNDPVQGTNANLAEYQRLIQLADVDILIFPESTLNNFYTPAYIPEPDDIIVPCLNSSYQGVIRTISCAAMSKNMYIVINVKEVANCPDKQQIEFQDSRPCNINGTNIYNTNVVFDRQGLVISKYRKFNLFGENGTLKPLKPTISTFTTDFNVTFGQFICFDLMFGEPALHLINAGIKDIIFTTNWYSELPFLTAVQIQQAWAQRFQVNFLAAGANNPSIGSTGTGIYHSTFGPITAHMASGDNT